MCHHFLIRNVAQSLGVLFSYPTRIVGLSSVELKLKQLTINRRRTVHLLYNIIAVQKTQNKMIKTKVLELVSIILTHQTVKGQ